MVALYQGKRVLRQDKDYLIRLERKLGEPIPHLDEIKEDSFGFTTKNYRIVGLGLYNKKNLPTLPYFSISHYYSYQKDSLSYLQTLNLNHCSSLDYIPFYIALLPRLESLNLSHTGKLPTISTFKHMKNLKYLDITGIPLIEEYKKVLNNLPNLKVITTPIGPDLILKNLKSKKLTKTEAYRRLLSLIENCDLVLYRARSIEIIEKLDIKNDTIFKVLENCLTSDEDAMVRGIAFKAIAKIYPEKGLTALDWAVNNEKSYVALKLIFKTLENLEGNELNSLKVKFENQLSSIFQVVPEEIKFLLDLEASKLEDPEYPNELREDYYPDYYKSNDLNDLLYGDAEIIIKDRHIEALSLSGIEEIPDSISNLSKLSYLSIRYAEAPGLPESLGKLHNLEYLEITNNNNMLFLPDCISKLKNLRTLILRGNENLRAIPDSILELLEENFAAKFIQKGVDRNDAAVLSLLEILLPGTFRKAELNERLYDEITLCHYKINKKGRVIGLYISNDDVGPGHVRFVLNFIPIQIGKLTLLKELIINLYLVGIYGYGEIPESFGNLKQLEYLDLGFNDIKKIPKFLKILPSLKYIDLKGNPINYIPKWIKPLYQSSKLVKQARIRLEGHSHKSLSKIIEYLQKAIKIHPSNSLAWLYLTKTYLKLKKNEQAINAYERYIKLDPKDINAKKLKSVIEAKIYSKLEIIDILNNLVIKFSKNINVPENLLVKIAVLTSKKGDLRYGKELLKRALKLAKNRNLKAVTVNNIKSAEKETNKIFIDEYLQEVPESKLLFIFSVISAWKHKNSDKITLKDVMDIYNGLPVNYHYNGFYYYILNYIQRIRKDKIVQFRITKSRQMIDNSIIVILNKNLPELVDVISNILNSKGIFHELYNQAEFFFKFKEFENAIRMCDLILEFNPKLPEFSELRKRCEIKKGEQ